MTKDSDFQKNSLNLLSQVPVQSVDTSVPPRMAIPQQHFKVFLICLSLPQNRTVCYEILREILRESRQFSAREFRILAAQVVIDLFLEEESQSLAMLEDFIGKPVSIQAESSYSQEQFDIVLL
jgi:hypothetical protein